MWAEIGAAAGGLISSLFSHHKSKGTSNYSYSDMYDDDTAKALIGGISNTSPTSSWSDIGKFLSTLGDDIGLYANNAFDYYMADRAYLKQENYNKWALQQEQKYNEKNMNLQYKYGLKNMSQQYKYDVAMQNRSYENSLALQTAQNDWSKMMSDTSHQREVADLRAAGLNPILSANGGANAYTSGSAIISGNTPTGGMPSGGSPHANGVQQPDYSNASQRSIARENLKLQRAIGQASIANARTQSLVNLAQVGAVKASGEKDEMDALSNRIRALSEVDANNASAARSRSEAAYFDAKSFKEIPAIIAHYKSGMNANNASAASSRARALYDMKNAEYIEKLKSLLGTVKSEDNSGGLNLTIPRLGNLGFNFKRGSSKY